MSLSPTRLRRRSFLNDPPGYTPNVPGHSILLNGPAREPSPDPSASSHSHSHAEADAIAAKAALGTVSFAPLPVIPPELKRRSSITLGVAARKNLLSSPEDEIYPDPRKKAAAPGNGGAPQGNGSVRSVYMNDQDWEEYKRQHAVKNGNEVVDIGELVTNQAKNLWRKVKPSPTQQKAELGPDTSPTTSTSSGGMFSSLTSPKLGMSPGSSNGLLGSFSAPKLSIRRRSDPGTSGGLTTKENITKSPDLANVEEESLSRHASAEQKATPSSPTSPKFMDWEKKPRSSSIGSDPQSPDVPSPPSAKSPHGPPSPPPRVQDVLPSEDEVKENHQEVDEEQGHGTESEDDFKDAEDVVGTMDLEKVEIQSEAGDGHHRQPEYKSGGRDSAVLGFDRSRFGGD